MKPLKYYIQKFWGIWMSQPYIPSDKTTGYSLVKSERVNCQLGKNVHVVEPYYLFNVKMGDNTYVARNVRMANTSTGKFCSIGPNCTCGLGFHPTNAISSHFMFYRGRIEEYKPVMMGNDVYLGANVTVLDGVSIGDGAMIGAGAVVSKDIPPYAIAVGCPIQIKKFRLTDKQIAAMQRIQWWNFDEESLKDVYDMDFDIEAFIAKYDTI